MNMRREAFICVVIGVVVGVIAGIQPIFALAGGAAILALAVGFGYPMLMLSVLPLAVFLWEPLATIGGFNFTYLDAVIGFFYLHLLFFLPRYKKLYQKERLLVQAWQMMCLAWIPILFSIFGAMIYLGVNQAIPSLIYIKRWCEYSVLPVGMLMLCHKGQLKYIFLSLAVANILFFLSSVVGVSIMGESANFAEEKRAAGLLFNPNMAGIAAVLLMNSYCAMLSKSKESWLRIAFGAGILMNLTILISTASREALVGLLVSCFMWLLFEGRVIVRHIPKILIVGVLFITALSFSDVGEHMAERVGQMINSGGKEDNVVARIEAQMVALNILAEYPMGIGVGNINMVSRDAMFSGEVFSFKYLPAYEKGIGTSDNQFVDGFVENGLIGEAVFIACLWRIYQVVRDCRAKDLQVNMVMLCIVGMAGYTFYAPFVASLFWLLIGIKVVDARRS